jgi:hypothetical protein
VLERAVELRDRLQADMEGHRSRQKASDDGFAAGSRYPPTTTTTGGRSNASTDCSGSCAERGADAMIEMPEYLASRRGRVVARPPYLKGIYRSDAFTDFLRNTKAIRSNVGFGPDCQPFTAIQTARASASAVLASPSPYFSASGLK